MPLEPVLDAETIAAISTPPGGARRGILRLSGPDACELIGRTVFSACEPGGELETPPLSATKRCVVEARFHDGEGSQPVLLFWMPGPRSYTREDVAELHLLGSEPLLGRALSRLLELGARAALPGEFTRRAFLHGRIDLTRAEGVLELVRATNDAERRSALQLLDGGLDRRVARLRESLEAVRALFEASLDFDETDTGHVPREELAQRLDDIRRELERALSWEVARQPPEARPRVLLFGAPNAGKSSLFNALLEAAGSPASRGRPGAIVSDLAGTTRDYSGVVWRPASSHPDRASPVAVREPEVLLQDTPGLQEGVAGADASAQRLGTRERSVADVILWVVAATRNDSRTLAAEARALPAGTPVVGLWSQVDRPAARPAPPDELGASAGEWISVSALTGTGMGEIGPAVLRALLFSNPSDAAGHGPGGGAARGLFARHRQALEGASLAVETAREDLEAHRELDLVAETLRRATRCLDDIEGHTTSEDLLDRIFAQFCLGK